MSENPPVYDDNISSHGDSFKNCVTFYPASNDFPEGLIISGGKDMTIEVKQPGRPPEENAEALLIGHSHNVCALDSSSEGGYIVSGSWDGSARVWSIGNWECAALLEGHSGSVWAVLAYDKGTIITGSLISVHYLISLMETPGCADQKIRFFSPGGKLLHTFQGSNDVVRALCRLPSSHPSGAAFASAGNDGIIHLWRLDGRAVGELHGHENFVYSIASLPNGEIISGGEDRTARIWKGNTCIQTITHPAISVWGVAACVDNGDFATGASDRKVRVFSRSEERKGDPQVVQEFEDSVKSSAIPQQQVGDVNKEKLPGPEFLQQKSGTKEGQVVMIKENDGSVTAHQWSQTAQKWVNVGTVVDAVGSSGKKTTYLGVDYDYVFDVDIEDGKPALKLPYNLSQNPYEAATKFVQDNELPITYLEQVADFITTNTQGATIGQSSQPSGPDAWGTENRYRPGDSAAVPTQPTSTPKVLPQTSYLAIKSTNLRTVLQKIEELNQKLNGDGDPLSSEQLQSLRALAKPLEGALASGPKEDPSFVDGITAVFHILLHWPPSHQLPALDLLRLLAAATPQVAAGNKSELEKSLLDSDVIKDLDRQNNVMLGIRTLSNLFETPSGRSLAENLFDKVHQLVQPLAKKPLNNRNLMIAISTLYLNYAVMYTSAMNSERALLLLDDLTALIHGTADAETLYRALVAAGTLLSLGEEVKMAAKEVFDYEKVIKVAAEKGKESRINVVGEEIKALLG